MFVWIVAAVGVAQHPFEAWFYMRYTPLTDIRIHYALNKMLFDKATSVDTPKCFICRLKNIKLLVMKYKIVPRKSWGTIFHLRRDRTPKRIESAITADAKIPIILYKMIISVS